MRKFIFLYVFLFCGICFAHFGMIIPDVDYVGNKNESTIGVKIMFAHPFDGQTITMERPEEFGVIVNGDKVSLTNKLKETKVIGYNEKDGHTGYFLKYTLEKPGDYIFYFISKPYWESADDKYTIHYTKVIVNGFELQDAWYKEIGLKTEIVPLTCPYTIYKGNTFSGIVKVDGNVAPFTDVKVEYYNENGRAKIPNPLFETQIIKCDGNGVFSYSFPESGWWGFSAVNTDDKNEISYRDKLKKVEIGADLWIRVHIFRK